MLRHEVGMGMRVRINTPGDPRWHGKLGTVHKVNPKNIKVMLDIGGYLNASPVLLEKSDEPAPPPTAYAQALADVPPPAGTLVRRSPGPGKLPAGFYVVLGESRREAGGMKIAKLGGDNNRYWTVPVNSVTVVEKFNVEVLD